MLSTCTVVTACLIIPSQRKKRLKIKIDDSLKLYWLMLQNEAGVTFSFFFVLIFDDPAQTY